MVKASKTRDKAAPKQDQNTQHHLNICRDVHGTKACEAQKEQCHLKKMRRFCARTCKTCTPLIAPVQTAWLMDGELPIPESADYIFVEVGASDRNTVDEELLPRFPNAFLVTAEPLIEKYARGVGRRRPANTVQDLLEPLGQHHDRGFILPVAVAPMQGGTQKFPHMSGEGEMRELKVGVNAGCASLLKPNRSRHVRAGGSNFGVWCDTTGHGMFLQGRQVWTVPLRQVLQWVGQPVDFLKGELTRAMASVVSFSERVPVRMQVKLRFGPESGPGLGASSCQLFAAISDIANPNLILFLTVDAQGMDLEVVRSGNELLSSRVRRVLLEASLCLDPHPNTSQTKDLTAVLTRPNFKSR